MPETTITATVPNHGMFVASAYQVERAMLLYLPASPAELRERVQYIVGSELDYSDVTEVSTLLVILASFDSPY